MFAAPCCRSQTSVILCAAIFCVSPEKCSRQTREPCPTHSRRRRRSRGTKWIVLDVSVLFARPDRPPFAVVRAVARILKAQTVEYWGTEIPVRPTPRSRSLVRPRCSRAMSRSQAPSAAELYSSAKSETPWSTQDIWHVAPTSTWRSATDAHNPDMSSSSRLPRNTVEPTRIAAIKA